MEHLDLDNNMKLFKVFRKFKSLKRKYILPLSVGTFVVVVPLLYLVIKNLDTVEAATLSVTENSGNIQIDVPNRYRAILAKGDTSAYITLFDRHQDDASPDQILENRYDGRFLLA